ncbi:MAG: type III pantothenate kinase [Desulfovibrionaceae bacterium]
MTLTAVLADMGNTSLKFCLGGPDGLGPAHVAATAEPGQWKQAALNALAHAKADEPRALVAASVVPGRETALRELAHSLDLSCHLVPGDISLDIENRYARPEEVGADRLTVAFAARRSYGAKRLIVLDFGTATTFDCVSENAYLGGLICPGVRSSIRSFTEDTAKLPRPSLEVDASGLHVGRSTMDSLNQGVVFGFASMVEGLVPRLERELGGTALVVATGGYAGIIAQVCTAIHEVRGDLVMEGLRLAWLEFCRAK